MSTAIVDLSRSGNTLALLMPANPSKDHKHRIGRFCDWLEARGDPWHQPDLAAYRDHLLAEGKKAATVSAHLSTVRARYRDLTTGTIANDLRQAAYDHIPADADLRPADRKAIVDERMLRLENTLDPKAAAVKTITKQDEVESGHLRLTKAQADALLAAPGLGSLQAIRDTALIALGLCTGLREAELVGLDVGDLRQEAGGELGIHVRKGKGSKARFVPYGAQDWALAITEAWLRAAGITEGAVFRGLWRGGRKVRPSRLTTRAVGLILEAYPISIGGEIRTVKPHDLRRTYARRLYEAGLDPVALQQNLGHADLKTTLGYVGALGMDKRRPPSVYSFDLGGLANVIA